MIKCTRCCSDGTDFKRKIRLAKHCREPLQTQARLNPEFDDRNIFDDEGAQSTVAGKEIYAKDDKEQSQLTQGNGTPVKQ